MGWDGGGGWDRGEERVSVEKVWDLTEVVIWGGVLVCGEVGCVRVGRGGVAGGWVGIVA